MNGLAVGLADGLHPAKVTFVLRRTVAQNVTLGGVGTFDRTAGAHFKALSGSLFTFHFRHWTDFLLFMFPPGGQIRHGFDTQGARGKNETFPFLNVAV